MRRYKLVFTNAATASATVPTAVTLNLVFANETAAVGGRAALFTAVKGGAFAAQVAGAVPALRARDAAGPVAGAYTRPLFIST